MSPASRQHEWIKMQLRLGGSSLAEVARELAVSRTTVTSVCQGRHRSRRIEAAIAAKLHSAPQQLWPERYASLHGAFSHVPEVGSMT